MSVGPSRGAVQRPGADRDFTEIFQRIDDLERAGGNSGFVDQAYTGIAWNATVGEVVSIALPRLIVSRNGNPPNAETLGSFTWRLIAGEASSMDFVWYGSGNLFVQIVKFYIVRLSTGTRAIYTGNGTTAASGVQGFLTLDAKSSGTALLDLTNPAAPSVVATDVYAVTSYLAAIPV